MFDRIVELTDLHLHDEISPEQLAELEALILENKEAAATMLVVLKQAGMMRVVFSEQQQFATQFGEANLDEYLALLKTLNPSYELDPVTLHDELSPGPADDPANPSTHDLAVVVGWQGQEALGCPGTRCL